MALPNLGNLPLPWSCLPQRWRRSLNFPQSCKSIRRLSKGVSAVISSKTATVGWCVLCLAISARTLAGQAADTPPKDGQRQSKFLRVARDEGNAPVALETAIVHCVPRDCGKRVTTVDLIAAVHVAEKSYFERLNRLFKKYDAVLYELVAPEGTRVPQGGPGQGGSPVSVLQNYVTGVLELDFQLNRIDYNRKNLIHADMSPDQFARSMQARGESVWTMFMRALGYAIARQSKDPAGLSDAKLLLALLDKDRALALKRVLAEQFEDLEGSVMALDGPDGSTLISERNKAALVVLRNQIALGKRKIAIFYGAGHMQDFERRLRDDFGLVRLETTWVPAWNLKGPASPKVTPRAAGKRPSNRRRRRMRPQ